MNKLKRILPDVAAIVFFVVVAFAYFFTPVTEGLVLSGHDNTGGTGAGVEMNEYLQRTGERTRWTNSLFCGMPTYQLAPSYNSTDLLAKVEKVYQLGLPDVVMLVFIMLLGFYILLRAFDFRVWMAALGAVLWAFSSYFFIILGAGHIWKLMTLAFIPPTLAGMVLCYKGKYLWGGVVTAFFVALQIFSNHVQMSYYFLSVVALMALAFLIEAGKNGTVKRWLKGTAVFVAGGLLGVCVNLSNLYHTYEYSKESMRGKSELTQKSSKNPANQTKNGLERDYITQWSYGIGETWTLLVPNVKGGASLPLAANQTAMAKANPQYAPIYQSMGQYWGEQPGTSGPVYVGAFVLMLFVLGLFIVRGPMKWCLLVATVLSVLLSWGKNFMPFTDFFLDYVPMYDKFRTVASILVVAEFTIPFLAMLALKKIVDEPTALMGRIERPHNKVIFGLELLCLLILVSPLMSFAYYLATKKRGVAVGISFLCTGGVAFLFALMPDLFFGTYLSTGEMAMLQQAVAAGYIPSDMLGGILSSVEDMRRAMFVSDAWRSFFVVLLGLLLILSYNIKKLSAGVLVACLTALCLVDMWQINKRYLNDGMFTTPTQQVNLFAKTQADELILQDPAKYYRVLNLAVSTFNDNTTSYYHKSIGGYHAAKLRRYQEMIEEHIQPEMMAARQALTTHQGKLDEVNGDSIFPVLNMLNTKYIIVGLQGGQTLPVLNPHAYGNGWFVDEVRYVADADAEIGTLHQVNPRRTAVVDARFKDVLGDLSAAAPDSTATVTLTAYEANALSYEVNSQNGGVAVFSEVYYPGWTATVDGQPVEIARADYILRAIRLAPGKHTVEFKFDPQSLHITETIAYSALALLLLVVVGLLVQAYRRTGGKEKKTQAAD